MSRAITEPVSVAEIKDWHTVNQFAPPSFHISPHYRFHGALSQVREVEVLQAVYELTQNDVASIARQLLIEWQTNGRDFAASRFLNDKRVELEKKGGKRSP